MNILKTGSKVLTIGNHFMQFGRTLGFSSVLGIITQGQGAFNFNTLGGIAIDPPSTAFPNGRIFVTNYGNNTVSILNYSNPTAGSPTIITVAQGSFSYPTGIAIDRPSTAFPNGRIFVTNYVNNTVSILNYSNPTAGSPTIITAAQGSFSFGNYFADIAIDAVGNRIFVINSVTNSTVSILNYSNPTAGNPEVITTAQGSFSYPSHIAMDPIGNRIFVTNVGNTVSILNYSNPIAGSPTIITAAQGSLNAPTGIAIDRPNNRIFIMNRNGNNTVSILNYSNPTAGSPTIITAAQGSLNSGYQSSIAIDPLGNRIFAINANNNTVTILSNLFT